MRSKLHCSVVVDEECLRCETFMSLRALGNCQSWASCLDKIRYWVVVGDNGDGNDSNVNV